MSPEYTNELVKKFTAHLKLEKGLSENTLEAYLNDTAKLLQFAESENKPVTDLTTEDLHRFVYELQDIGICARSQARILSGVKAFFRFLKLDGYIDSDPSELIETPKLGRKLPEILTVEEIDAMVGSIDLSLPEGRRNRAILETLYGCGLRVSELTGLRISQLYLDDGYILVEGKGSKQRLVPISPAAIHEIRLYMLDRGYSVSQPAGRTTDTGHDILHYPECLRSLRNPQNHQPAHIAAFVRHAPARTWSQPTCHTTDARARKHHHDRNLCPFRQEFPPAGNPVASPPESKSGINLRNPAPFEIQRISGREKPSLNKRQCVIMSNLSHCFAS